MAYSKGISALASIVFGVILYRLFLKETITVTKLISAAICFIGLCLVVQPEVLFKGDQYREISTSYTHLLTKLEIIVGYILAITQGLTHPLPVIIQKRSEFISNNFIITLFWASAIRTVASAILMVIFESPILPASLDSQEMWCVILHCSSNVAVLLLMMCCTKYVSGNTFLIINASVIIAMLIPQYTILKDIIPGHRNWIEVVGVVLVALSCCLSSILEIVSGKEKPVEE